MNLRSAFYVAVSAMIGIAPGPAGLRAQDPAKERPPGSDHALGKLLFTDVVRVYFTGPGHPANTDGSLGGLVADEPDGSINIYENYICRESAGAGGLSIRELHAYDKLGRIEQRRARAAAGGATDLLPAERATLLASPPPAQTNFTASPKFDERVVVYTAEPVTASVTDHHAGDRWISLDAGAKDGVRIGHTFQIVEAGSRKRIGAAKVTELGADRSVAGLVILDGEHAARSLKGFTAVCTEPEAKPNETVIECRFGKDVWQTESLENKLIRGLLESCGKNVRIWIRQENTVRAPNDASE